MTEVCCAALTRQFGPQMCCTSPKDKRGSCQPQQLPETCSNKASRLCVILFSPLHASWGLEEPAQALVPHIAHTIQGKLGVTLSHTGREGGRQGGRGVTHQSALCGRHDPAASKQLLGNSARCPANDPQDTYAQLLCQIQVRTCTTSASAAADKGHLGLSCLWQLRESC